MSNSLSASALACARLLDAHIRTGMFWPKTLAEHVARHGPPQIARRPRQIQYTPRKPIDWGQLIICNQRIEEHASTHTRVIAGIAKKCGVSIEDIKGRKRRHDLVIARRRISKILRRHGYSLNAIGRVLGGRDHATIMHYLGRKRRAAA